MRAPASGCAAPNRRAMHRPGISVSESRFAAGPNPECDIGDLIVGGDFAAFIGSRIIASR